MLYAINKTTKEHSVVPKLDTKHAAPLKDKPWWSVYQPEPPEWSGEGLPPIGVECEYRDAAIPCNHHDWRECILLARFGEWLCVVEHKHGDPMPHVRSILETKFRPIRSAEDKAVEEMQEHVGGYVKRDSILKALYRAGYRKEK